MEKSIINVEGMACEHCVNAITKAVGELHGISDVSVDLAGKTVTVAYEPEKTQLEKIKAEIEGQGFDVVDK